MAELHTAANASHPLQPSRLGSAVALSLLMLAAPPASLAATIEVDTNLDDNANTEVCSLRAAINSLNVQTLQNTCTNAAADGFGVNDRIIFSEELAGQTILLNGTPLAFGANFPVMNSRSLEIDASSNGSLTIDANQQSGAFDLRKSAVTLNNLTITGGNATFGGGLYLYRVNLTLNHCHVTQNFASSSGGGLRGSVGTSITLHNSTVTNNSSVNGGGLTNFGPTTLQSSTVSANTASSTGGGIRPSGLLHLIGSTVSNNSAGSTGGGLEGAPNSTIVVTNSTISGNTANTVGAALLSLAGTVTLNNSTVARNMSNNATYNDVGGIFLRDNASLSLHNSIVADNSGYDCSGGFQRYTVTTDAASIVEKPRAQVDSKCGVVQRNIDPLLASLALNGGPTLSHALQATSPARNTGILGTCETEDQRGKLRDDGDSACDVGAIEFDPNDLAGFFVIPVSNGNVVVVPE